MLIIRRLLISCNTIELAISAPSSLKSNADIHVILFLGNRNSGKSSLISNLLGHTDGVDAKADSGSDVTVFGKSGSG